MSPLCFRKIGCALLAVVALAVTGCAYARSGKLLYLPSDANPQYTLFMATSLLDRHQHEDVPRKRLLQIYFGRKGDKGWSVAFTTKITARDVDYTYTHQGGVLMVTVKEEHGSQLWRYRFVDEGRKKWRVVEEQKPN